MKKSQISHSFAMFLFLASSPLSAEVKMSEGMKAHQSIDKVVDFVKKSKYKEITVSTLGGSFTGEFYSKTKSVLVLKNKTGLFVKDKEKFNYTIVNIDSIIAVSYFGLK